MVFYFTGTGNSLYVAKRIDQNPISIPQALRSENLHFHSDSIGIVCPIYGSEPPYMVQEFLKRAQFETNYLYIIMTYGCSNGAAMQIIRKIAEECHLSLAYTRTVKMVDNYLPGFDMDAEKAIDKKVDLQMADILRDLSNRKYDLEETKPEDMVVYQNYLAFTAEHPDQGWKQVKFSTTEKCNGCGLCAQVCSGNCIQIKDGRAFHSGINCQVCLACIHHCPQNAVQLSVQEVNPNARYIHPQISIKEILAANHWEDDKKTL